MVFPDFVTEYFYFIGEASLTTKRNKCERGKKHRTSCQALQWQMKQVDIQSAGLEYHVEGNYMVGAVQEKDQSLNNHSREHQTCPHIFSQLLKTNILSTTWGMFPIVSVLIAIESQSLKANSCSGHRFMFKASFFFCTYCGPIARGSYCKCSYQWYSLIAVPSTITIMPATVQSVGAVYLAFRSQSLSVRCSGRRGLIHDVLSLKIIQVLYLQINTYIMSISYFNTYY